MNYLRVHNMQYLSSTLFVCVGCGIILLALTSFLTNMTLAELFEWVEQYFSISFTVIYLLLTGLAMCSYIQLKSGKYFNLWKEVGIQSASGISTLALTFTLLGISLGIGSLSEQSLTPDTVQVVISELTSQFSMAFMTTVVGLPTSALIRAMLAVKSAAIDADFTLQKV